MKKAKHEYFWCKEIEPAPDGKGVHLHMLGVWPKYSPYLRFETPGGIFLGTLTGRRQLKSLRTAINKALGEK